MLFRSRNDTAVEAGGGGHPPQRRVNCAPARTLPPGIDAAGQRVRHARISATGPTRKHERLTGRPLHLLLSDHLTGQDVRVKRVNLADAKAHLSEPFERAAVGEAVCITRRGKVVAQITAVDTARKCIDEPVDQRGRVAPPQGASR